MANENLRPFWEKDRLFERDVFDPREMDRRAFGSLMDQANRRDVTTPDHSRRTVDARTYGVHRSPNP